VKPSFATREEWLEAAMGLLWALLPDQPTRPAIKISVGWPKGANDKVTLGQCFNKRMSMDGECAHIFISPKQVEPLEVLRTVLHEMIHAVVGTEEGHRGKFAVMARQVGFEKPWTATPLSEALKLSLGELVKGLGDYPHIGLNPAVKKQGTRMKLWVCSCGVKLRRAGKLNAQCLDCETLFVLREDVP
jgi:hypothetical protein